jgi:hypothetical protein
MVNIISPRTAVLPRPVWAEHTHNIIRIFIHARTNVQDLGVKNGRPLAFTKSLLNKDGLNKYTFKSN